jgi:hypothetical protein
MYLLIKVLSGTLLEALSIICVNSTHLLSFHCMSLALHTFAILLRLLHSLARPRQLVVW